MMNAERLNIQVDSGQTMYKNKTLTYSLQQSAQETNWFVICSNQPREPAAVSQACRKSGCYPE